MAEILVEREHGVPWWVWLIGLLFIASLWVWLGRDDREGSVGASSPDTATPARSIAYTPTEPPTPTPRASPAPVPGSAATSALITDPGVYAATADKVALVGREVAFTGAIVARVVGPKTFTVVSGTDEFFVVIDEDGSTGVGSQGRIDIGNSVDLRGTFQTLPQDAINDISNRRFRTLTELERETLRKTQVYLPVTKVSGLS